MKRNRILGLCLALALVFTMMSGAAWAEGTDREVVDIQMISLPSNSSGPIEGWIGKYLMDELAIRVELLPAGDQGEQKLQALMAAGSLPDMIVFKDAKQILDAQRAGMLVAFDDYADVMPNAQTYAKTAMQYYADSASTDGKCYAIPNEIGTANLGDDLNWSISLRWDLYKELGTPEIKTYRDYLTVLQQMMELEPTNEDGQKVYAISMWSDWDNYTMHQAMQPSVLVGVDSGDQMGAKLPFAEINFTSLEMSCILDEDSEYIKGLRFLYDANQMGLVDPDSMTQRFDTAVEKAKNGRVLFGWWNWAVSGYNSDDRTDADDFKGFATVIPEDYKAFLTTDKPVGSPWAWAISSNSKNIDRCIEYIEFMLDPEKMVTLQNGPKGETWDINDEGTPYVTEKGMFLRSNPNDLLEDGGKLSDGFNLVNSYLLSPAIEVPSLGEPINGEKWSTYEKKVTNLIADWRETMGYKNGVERSLALGMYTPMPLAASFVAPLSDEVQMLAQQIGDVVKTDSWLIVYAQDDAEYDKLVSEMIEKAKGLGLDQIMEYNQAAWKDAIELASKYE